MRILLIRHGENDFVGKRLAGRMPDVHLNDKGKSQAQELVGRLRNVKLNAIYSSPLERTIETAAPLSRAREIPIQISEGLSEIDFGTWEGKTLKQLSRLKLWKVVQETPSKMCFPMGETLVDAQKRIVSEILRLSSEYQEESTVACFSHSDLIRLATAHFLKTPLDDFQRIIIHPASITVIGFHKNLTRVVHVNQVNDL